MSYSARQLRCLNAMGLVAWTNSGVPAPQAGVELTAPLAVSPQCMQDGDDKEGSAPIASARANGSSEPDLAMWLVEQSLLPFTFRGSAVNCIGPEQASLLVVCLDNSQKSDDAGQLPMSADCTQLFELMMRGINLSRSGYRQCVVNAHDAEGNPDKQADSVSTLCNQQTRAILVVDCIAEHFGSTVTSHGFVMPESSLPLWRVAHPRLLMQTPALKRDAWEALKSLQKVLVA